MEKVEVNSRKWLDVKDLEDERWVIINEAPNYAISDYGRLKRLEHVFLPNVENNHVHERFLKERICKLYKNRSGYLSFRVISGNQFIQLYIHKIVAKYFVLNPDNLIAINHKDEDKTFNHYTNLEFCTNKYNSNYGTCQQRRAETIKENRRKKGISIDQYTFDGTFVHHYSTKGELDDAGFYVKTVLRVCRHQCETSQGYVWRFGNESFNKPEYVDSAGGTYRRKVFCYDLNGKFLKEYNNLLEAAEAIGGKHKRPGISSCANGKTKQAYGYIWRYANN